MHTIKQTGDWLKNNHIHVNDDWLKACVEWIQEENQGQGLTNDDINSQVYEQWLLADLHELETCCLPGEITTSQKFELIGTYALQIDSIVDVGVSFYSQQQKLKGTENANVHVNAEEPTQRPWEAKPSRMLMFKLTDGTHNVQGMEYRPISCLSPQTTPGAKILVHGNVLCRHSVLMLTDCNIKFLGGEVDTLVEANTVLNTLQSAMAASEEYAGKEHKQTFAGTPIRHCKQPVTSNQVNPGNQSRSWGNSRGSGNQFSQKGKTETKPFNKMKSEPVTQGSFTGNNQLQNQTVSDYDELLDDDMDSLMQEMTDDDFETNYQNRNSNNQVLSNNQSAYQNPNTSGSRQVTAVQNKSMKSSNSRSDAGIASRIQMTSSSVSANQTSARAPGTRAVLTSEDLVAMEFEDDMDFPSDDFMTSSTVSFQQSNQNSNNPSVAGASAKNSNNKTQSHFIKQNFGEKKSNAGMECQVSNSSSYMNPNKQTISSESGKANSSINLMDGSQPVMLNNVDMTVNISNKGVNLSIKSRNQVSKSGASNEANRNTDSKLGLSKIKSEAKNREVGGTVSSNIGGQSRQSSIQSFLTPNKEKTEQPVKESIGTDIQTEYPFTYLSKVMSLPVQTEPSYHTVKAYISTLTSRLSSAAGKWTLSCKINDGTMAVDVDLSNNVLTEMIGFSWKEAQEMKLRLKTDPGVKEVLTEGIQQCQQKLIELMCLLELEICSRNTRPVIVATKQLTSHHIDMLYNRVMANWNTKS